MYVVSKGNEQQKQKNYIEDREIQNVKEFNTCWNNYP